MLSVHLLSCVGMGGNGEQQQKSKEMDKCPSWEKSDLLKQLVKPLLPSAGERGKCTLLKQVCLVRGQDLSAHEESLRTMTWSKMWRSWYISKEASYFLKEVIQTNSMERRWWHLTPGLSWQPTEWWKCQVWGFVFQSFFSENIMGREKHRESLWTVWKNSAGWISKNISLITDKFGEQDYTP